MSDALFSALELGTDPRAGYRMSRLEVRNWGTFDRQTWRLEPAGETVLLTGDIGSGKSTLVDAITTLLLPAQRISYNKAAGAESKERTLRSYVEGHYTSRRIETTGTTQAVGLRGPSSFSVILGVFVNDGYGETVSLAQVFHAKDRAGQPDRFYVISAKELSIDTDFTDFGSDLADLRRRLRAGGADIHNTFPEYSRQLRRALGVRSEQAMELFHQTVSMKSVGNLNEFVRKHMLEAADSTDRVRHIVNHFEDLTKAHDAVVRAGEQLEALSPLVAAAAKYDAAVQRHAEDEARRDAVRSFIAEHRIALLDADIDESIARQQRLNEAEVAARTRDAGLRQEHDQLLVDRAGAGGDRLGELERQRLTAAAQIEDRAGRRVRFTSRLADAGLAEVSSAAEFAALGEQISGEEARLSNAWAEAEARIDELGVRHRDVQNSAAAVRAELASLADRRNNLPESQLAIRGQLCRDLGIVEAELPFAGELIDVAEQHATWRGAAERVLRGFATSLLVGPEHYEAVTGWVDGRRLTHRRHDGTTTGVKLVYERVPDRRLTTRPVGGDGSLRLVDCLEVAPGRFQDHLRVELARRADHRCAETLAEFRVERRAVTRAGQVRSGERHEKDDRSRVDDPRTWVLGWMNERKIAALTEHLLAQQAAFEQAKSELAVVRKSRDALVLRRTALGQLREYTAWPELDVAEARERLETVERERERLLAGSSALNEVERRIEVNKAAQEEVSVEIGRLGRESAVLEDRVRRDRQTQENDRAQIASLDAGALARHRTRYPALEQRLGRRMPRAAADCASASETLIQELQAGIDRTGREINGYGQSLVRYMSEVRRRWPEATTEMDASVEARQEYLDLHARIAGDDLPRFEEEFKRQLNTNTVRELAQLNRWLQRQAEEIGVRVGVINEALGAIDYNTGSYICLVAERTVNQEVQAFRADLRHATDDVLTGGEHYSEQRFRDVKQIIERFRGRDAYAHADRTWTERVTDVRNWFTFSASERTRDGDEEVEAYRDSDGKSGGQKEKLAYTILAASLAYQFGLEWGAAKSRDFRFAVIDEAFGRGSEASARYALDLFAKLGLQLLVVTPLQKVHVIEPYVRSIGYVDNPTGNYSRLRNVTIEELGGLRAGKPH